MATDVATAGSRDDSRDERDERESREERSPQRPDNRPDPRPDGRPAASRPGFFTIHKRGQGYWTRMGTAGAAALLGGLTAYNIYAWLPALMNLGTSEQALAREKQIALLVAVGGFAVFAALIWRLINKPANVDFLIATDSEMKKVNWTSRKELIGSTKVVIVFMFLIATFLFLVDIVFGYFFFVIKVLKNSPFGGGGTVGGG